MNLLSKRICYILVFTLMQVKEREKFVTPHLILDRKNPFNFVQLDCSPSKGNRHEQRREEVQKFNETRFEYSGCSPNTQNGVEHLGIPSEKAERTRDADAREHGQKQPRPDKQEILRMAQEKYPAFGISHLCELLKEREGISVPKETLETSP